MKNPIFARAKIYRIALDAMFLAIFVVLSLVPSELSWASLAALLCAFLVGPVDVLVVVLCGSFVEQMTYGLSFASVIWMLPWLVFGLVAGLGAYLVRRNPKPWKMIPVIVLSELLLNVANTLALLYFGYAVIDFQAGPLVVIGAFLARMPHAVVRALLSSVAMPLLLPPLKKQLDKLFH